MLVQPAHSLPYRLVGLDPGSNTFGASVLDVDLATQEISLIHAETFVGESLARAYFHVINVHGNRVARLMALEEVLYNFFRDNEPHGIIAESPYLGRFPKTFAALTEAITTIRRATFRYDMFMPLLMIDPTSVKNGVGMRIVKGKTKEDVKEAVKALKDLSNPYGIDLDALDEHSIDAIAVAYYRAKTFLGQFHV